MWRTISIIGVALAFCVGCQHSQPALQVQSKTVEPIPDEDVFCPPTRETLATRAKLAEKCPDISLRGQSLGEALDQMREVSGLSIFGNWRALEKHGVKKALPVTTALNGLTIGQALSKLLRDVGEPNVRIGYTVGDGVVTISTEENLSQNSITRVYDIRAALSEEHRSDDIAKVIRRIEGIEPLTWKDNGGYTGSTRELSGQLIVTHTPRVQRRIARELAEYRPENTYPLVNSDPKSVSRAITRD